MKFARYTFLIAGIYGLIVMLPQYFLEQRIAVDSPPAITHPEFFYGFIGITVAFQLVFLIISSDPIKYRLMIIPSLVEKFSFVIAVAALYAERRVGMPIIVGASLDAVLAILFIISWISLRKVDRSGPS
jgi:hypothetical protein